MEALGWPGLASSWPSNPLSVGPAIHHSEPLLSLATPQPGPPHLRSSTRGVLPNHPQNAHATLHPAWRVRAGQVWAICILPVPAEMLGGPSSIVCLGQPTSWHTVGAQ